MRLSLRQITLLGVVAALAVTLVLLIHFPLFPAAPYLEYDPADLPIILVTLILGPMNGLLLTAVVSVIQGLTVSVQSGPVGMLMHFLATGSFVLVAGNIYRLRRTLPVAAVAMVAGTLTMTAVMVALNLVVIPLYTGTPVEVVQEMLWPVIIPFNLFKAGLNSLLSFGLFRFLEAPLLGMMGKGRDRLS